MLQSHQKWADQVEFGGSESVLLNKSLQSMTQIEAGH